MKLKILAASFVIGLSVVTYKVATYNPVPEIVDQLRAGKPVTLDSGKVYDFTGFKDIPVTAPFNLNYATIKCDSMLQIGFNDNHYLFIVSDSIHSGKIEGANGRVFSNKIGYFNAIQVLQGGSVTNIHFNKCDKSAIMTTGNRFTYNDTIYVRGCTVDSTARNGSGYAIFNPYATLVAENNTFGLVRHAIDMGGSPNPSCIIRNNLFQSCYFVTINQHKIDGQGTCGSGLTITGNYFFGDAKPMQLVPPATGVIRIDSNYFAANQIGTIKDSIIPKGTNYLNGENMPIGAKISYPKRVYQTGEQITLKCGNKAAIWSNGGKGDKITTRSAYPSVRVYSCYTRGIPDTVTLLVQGSGKYTGVRAMSSGGSMEIYSGSEKLQTIPASKFYDYKYFYHTRDSVRLRFYPGMISIDDYVTDSYYQTFETGVDGLKIKYFGKASVSRKLYNVFSGYRNLTIEVDSGYVEVWR